MAEELKTTFIHFYNKKIISIILKYCEKNNCILKLETQIYINNIDVGYVYTNIIYSIKSIFDEYYILLSSNKYIKLYIDSNILFYYHYNLLIEFCNINLSMPNILTIYKNVNIGNWLNTIFNLLKNGDIAIYDKLLYNDNITTNIIKILIRYNKYDHLFINLLKEMDNTEIIINIDTIYKSIYIGKWFYYKIDLIKELQCPVYNFLNITPKIKKIIDDKLFLKLLNPNIHHPDLILYGVKSFTSYEIFDNIFG